MRKGGPGCGQGVSSAPPPRPLGSQALQSGWGGAEPLQVPMALCLRSVGCVYARVYTYLWLFGFASVSLQLGPRKV